MIDLNAMPEEVREMLLSKCTCMDLIGILKRRNNVDGTLFRFCYSVNANSKIGLGFEIKEICFGYRDVLNLLEYIIEENEKRAAREKKGLIDKISALQGLELPDVGRK